MSSKSVERKLFEAYTHDRGVRLTVDDVVDLLVLDDAIRTRITNAACEDAGLEEFGVDEISDLDRETWNTFIRRLKRLATETP